MSNSPSDGGYEANRRACEDAVLNFTAHFDAGEHQQMERYFADDGLWARLDGDIRGIDELRLRMAKRPSNSIVRHVITNLRTSFPSTDKAVVDSYVTVFRHVFADAESPPAPVGLPFVMGRYRDVLVRQDDSWRILERRSFQDFTTQAGRS